MSFYANPKTQTKKEWLTENASVFCGVPNFITKPCGKVFLCLVDNHQFETLYICYTEKEIEKLIPKGKERLKTWYLVSKEKLDLSVLHEADYLFLKNRFI